MCHVYVPCGLHRPAHHQHLAYQCGVSGSESGFLWNRHRPSLAHPWLCVGSLENLPEGVILGRPSLQCSGVWLCPLSPPLEAIHRALWDWKRTWPSQHSGAGGTHWRCAHKAGKRGERKNCGSMRKHDFFIPSVFPHLFSGMDWFHAGYSRSVLHSSCINFFRGRFIPIWSIKLSKPTLYTPANKPKNSLLLNKFLAWAYLLWIAFLLKNTVQWEYWVGVGEGRWRGMKHKIRVQVQVSLIKI